MFEAESWSVRDAEFQGGKIFFPIPFFNSVQKFIIVKYPEYHVDESNELLLASFFFSCLAG